MLSICIDINNLGKDETFLMLNSSRPKEEAKESKVMAFESHPESEDKGNTLKSANIVEDNLDHILDEIEGKHKRKFVAFIL